MNIGNEAWTATAQDVDKGYCLPEQVGAAFAGPRPSAPVYWTAWDALAGRCQPAQVGNPRPPTQGGSKTFPQQTTPGPSQQDEEYSGGEALSDDMERVLASVASLHTLSVEEQRQAQLQHLYLAVSALLPRASGGDRMAMETMVRLQARISSIAGLDQPRQASDDPTPKLKNVHRMTDDELLAVAAGAIVYRDRAA